MSYSVDNIVPSTYIVTQKGLSVINFASAILYAPESDNTGGTTLAPDTYLDFSDLTEVAKYFPETTETYVAASAYLGGSPSTQTITIYTRDDTDPTWTTTLNKARNQIFRYFQFVTKPIYDEAAPYTASSDLVEIAAWCESAPNGPAIFANCQSSVANVDAIRNNADSTDICSVLAASGYTRTFTMANKSKATELEVTNYAGIRQCKWFGSVAYTGVDTTITGEYKVLSGVTAEDLQPSDYDTMKLATKNCQFYTVISSPGSTVNGNTINSKMASGDWMDDIVNLDAFANTLQTSIYNTIAGVGKLPYTPQGYQLVLTTAQLVGEQFIQNGYLGPRNYTDASGNPNAFTAGYEMLSTAEDILNATTTERTTRTTPPLQMQIFRAGAIHIVNVVVEVY